ncbi:MAG: TonB-dependent receptor, partial [Flavobacteriales bacterium]|nr:TonB-dependent receptor [Flavobacteriales bacterium]
PVRYTWFDDNTPATMESGTEPAPVNLPSRTWLPGIFVQDEFSLSPSSTLLTGLRYDHHAVHGHIVTPRVNFRWKSDNGNNVVRVGLGSGYRVANIFTEDHAALTGARDVVFLENLMPETSWSLNLQWVHRYPLSEKWFFGWDISAFYTRFGNRIIADYDTDPDKIIYDNLDGFAISQGGVVNAELRNGEKFAVMVGCTAMDVFSVEYGMKQRQLFTENFAGVWSLSYRIAKCNLTIDYSGNVYSPMRLPLLGPLDPRRPESPWWSIQNIQLTKASGERLEIYGGVKNLLNWTPNRGNPFIIARAHDPFDQGVQFDPSGQALVTPDNPYGLTFDPTYVFGPNQGIRFFLGVRYRVG